jgi:hypothetical protein
MGLTPHPQPGPRDPVEEPPAGASPAPAGAPAASRVPPAGEDDLFRDPFADFAPSAR